MTVDVGKRRVNFSLKPSYFVNDPAAIAASDESDAADTDEDEDDGASQDGGDENKEDEEMGEDEDDVSSTDASGARIFRSEDADGNV